jgi:hypothetical protein
MAGPLIPKNPSVDDLREALRKIKCLDGMPNVTHPNPKKMLWMEILWLLGTKDGLAQRQHYWDQSHARFKKRERDSSDIKFARDKRNKLINDEKTRQMNRLEEAKKNNKARQVRHQKCDGPACTKQLEKFGKRPKR